MMRASLTPGNDSDRQIRIAPSDCVEAFEAVHARHLQIEQQQIDRRLQRELVQRGLEVAGLQRHDLGIQQLEKKSQPLAKQRMVVGVQNFHVTCAWLSVAPATRKKTRCPLAGRR